jgi:hypothetical protein
MANAMKIILLGLLLWCTAGLCAPGPNDITGNWSGTLKVGQTELRLLLKISKTPEGTLTARMDSLDQGARDLRVDKVFLRDGAMHFEVDLIKGMYDGTLDTSGTKATGQWRQGPQTLPLTFSRTAGNVAIFPPEVLSPADLAASKRAAEKLTGQWNGALTDGADIFHLALKIMKNTDGAASGTLDSLDQGLTGIPLSSLTYTDGKFHFAARGLGASYDGASFNDGTSVTGQWHQAGQTLPLNFLKTVVKAVPTK